MRLRGRLDDSDLSVGRVLYETDEHIGIEVGKGDAATFETREGDRFYTLVFYRPDQARSWRPWEEPGAVG